jgi:HEAT repeat protein
MASQLAEAFAGLSAPGQKGVLELWAGWLTADQIDTAWPTLAPCTARLLGQASGGKTKGTRSRALALVRAALDHFPRAEVVNACRDVIRACLQDPDPDNRLAAVHLASHEEVGLHQCLSPLLADPNAEVRKSVLVTLGPKPEAVNTEDLLPWLHDPDAVVRDACATALRARGLQEAHLKLGRLKSHPDPRVRLQVLAQLRQTQDIDTQLWLRSLTHDPSPAVRAAAVRAASETTLPQLADRIHQMANNDPCPTVRQLASHFLAYSNTASSQEDE